MNWVSTREGHMGWPTQAGQHHNNWYRDTKLRMLVENEGELARKLLYSKEKEICAKDV